MGFFGTVLESDKEQVELEIPEGWRCKLGAAVYASSTVNGAAVKGKVEPTVVWVRTAVAESGEEADEDEADERLHANTFMICILSPQTPQQVLRLTLQVEDSPVVLFTTGPGSVHLTGSLVPDPYSGGDMSDEDEMESIEGAEVSEDGEEEEKEEADLPSPAAGDPTRTGRGKDQAAAAKPAAGRAQRPQAQSAGPASSAAAVPVTKAAPPASKASAKSPAPSAVAPPPAAAVAPAAAPKAAAAGNKGVVDSKAPAKRKAEDPQPEESKAATKKRRLQEAAAPAGSTAGGSAAVVTATAQQASPAVAGTSPGAAKASPGALSEEDREKQKQLRKDRKKEKKRLVNEQKEKLVAAFPKSEPREADKGPKLNGIVPNTQLSKPLERTLAGGLKVVDKVIGSGKVATAGKNIGVLYEGSLTNGKVFDKNFNRKRPFSFTLGHGEVIKGWDKGVEGMRIGGQRELTIPAPLGYGRKGTDGIPGNATLQFHVELVAVSGR